MKLLLIPTWGLVILIDGTRCLIRRVVYGEPVVPVWKQPCPRNSGEEHALQGLGDLFAVVVVYGIAGLLWMIGALVGGAAWSTTIVTLLLAILAIAGIAVPKSR